jgi:type I restriction enzyme S subunit
MTDWPIRSLGEVCDFVRGVTYDKADARSEMKSGFIPLLRATNITEKGLLREDFVFVPKNGVRADQKLLSGDALITIASGSASVVGRSVLVEDPGEMTFGAFCGVLRPSTEILPRYLSHFMSSRSVRAAWSEAAQGTNINNLKRDDILQTECLLPPLKEQKRIVELLDTATARVTELTACYEQARTHANNLFASALRDVLESNPNWPVKTLGDICEFQNGYAFKSSEYVKSGHALIRIKNVQQGEIVPSDDVFVLIPKDGSLNQFVLDAGDILMSLTGYLGRIGRLNETDLPAALNQRVAKVSVKSKAPLVDGFLYRLLDSPWFRDQVEVYGRGAAQQNVGTSDISKIEIPVPPLEEQKQLVFRLDSMKSMMTEMVATYDAKLAAAKNLRQSILEATFAGEL